MFTIRYTINIQHTHVMWYNKTGRTANHTIIHKASEADAHASIGHVHLESLPADSTYSHLSSHAIDFPGSPPAQLCYHELLCQQSCFQCREAPRNTQGPWWFKTRIKSDHPTILCSTCYCEGISLSPQAEIQVAGNFTRKAHVRWTFVKVSLHCACMIPGLSYVITGLLLGERKAAILGLDLCNIVLDFTGKAGCIPLDS